MSSLLDDFEDECACAPCVRGTRARAGAALRGLRSGARLQARYASNTLYRGSAGESKSDDFLSQSGTARVEFHLAGCVAAVLRTRRNFQLDTHCWASDSLR